jgi:hypothetical protein
LVARAGDFGEFTDVWNGVDFNFNVRPRNGIILQGGTSTSRRSTNDCDVRRVVSSEPLPERGGAVPAYNPTQAFCDADGTFLTQFKALASYTVPRIDVQVSASMKNLPGPEILATFTATNALISPSLGRPLAGGASNVALQIVEPRSLYGDRINQVDLRFSKLLRFGSTRASVGIDLYNAFNSNAEVALNGAYDSWQAPIEILNARFAKFVLQLNF